RARPQDAISGLQSPESLGGPEQGTCELIRPVGLFGAGVWVRAARAPPRRPRASAGGRPARPGPAARPPPISAAAPRTAGPRTRRLPAALARQPRPARAGLVVRARRQAGLPRAGRSPPTHPATAPPGPPG